MDGILSYKGYSLVFEDGFDGPALDQSRAGSTRSFRSTWTPGTLSPWRTASC